MGDPRVCVFDLGNVMVFHHEARFFAQLAAACTPEAPAERLFYEAFDRADVGRGGDFDSLHPALVEAAGLHMTLPEFRLAWSDIFTANPTMVELVRGLPRPRALLSNTHEPHVSWIRQRFPDVFPLFDYVALSNEVGLAKPDPEFFRHVARLTGLPSARHIFTDDREDNVAVARSLGWPAFPFVGVEDCRRRLMGLGVW
jgi:HAD superfamily hydrolase (TIGR01509 family)